MRIVVSGGFDPLHSGHIRLLNQANQMSTDPLIIIVNNDEWLVQKKGYFLLPIFQRMCILSSMHLLMDHRTKPSGELNYASHRPALMIPQKHGTISHVCPELDVIHDVYGVCAFANGGDRGPENTPEAEWCEAHGWRMEYGLGPKEASSSDFFKNAVQMYCVNGDI